MMDLMASLNVKTFQDERPNEQVKERSQLVAAGFNLTAAEYY